MNVHSVEKKKNMVRDDHFCSFTQLHRKDSVSSRRSTFQFSNGSETIRELTYSCRHRSNLFITCAARTVRYRMEVCLIKAPMSTKKHCYESRRQLPVFSWRGKKPLAPALCPSRRPLCCHIFLSAAPCQLVKLPLSYTLS